MVKFRFTSPYLLLLTHSTAVLLRSLTVRVTVQFTVCFETVVRKEYSVWCFNSGHLMVGKGNPRLMHTQVKTSDWTLHPEFFEILGNTVNTQEGKHVFTSHCNHFNSLLNTIWTTENPVSHFVKCSLKGHYVILEKTLKLRIFISTPQNYAVHL